MKNSIKYTAGLIMLISCMILPMNGCRAEKVKEPSPEKTDYSVISPDNTEKEKIKDTVITYLQALGNKSQENLADCTTEDMPLYKDETAFDDLTNEIVSARLDNIDYENVQMKDDRLLVVVEYTLEYEGSSTDAQGSLRTPGEYSFRELFTLLIKDDEYRIEKTEHTAAG